MKDEPDVHNVTRKNHGQSNRDDPKEAQSEGVPWQFYFILGVITLGVLGLLGKAFGIF